MYQPINCSLGVLEIGGLGNLSQNSQIRKSLLSPTSKLPTTSATSSGSRTAWRGCDSPTWRRTCRRSELVDDPPILGPFQRSFNGNRFWILMVLWDNPICLLYACFECFHKPAEACRLSTRSPQKHVEYNPKRFNSQLLLWTELAEKWPSRIRSLVKWLEASNKVLA